MNTTLPKSNKYVNKLFIVWYYLLIAIKDKNRKIIYNQTISYIMSKTYQPKKRKRSKTHGFLVRKRTPGGRNVLKRRAQKGRKKLAA